MTCFHDVHGNNLEFSSGRRVATRRDNTFDCGVCALNFPLSDPSFSTDDDFVSPLNRVQLRVTRTDSHWKGGLGIGLSPQPPVPDALPESSRDVGEGWAFVQVPQEVLGVGTLVTLWVDFSTRELCYETSGNAPGDLNEDEDDDDDYNENNGELQLDDPIILDCIDNNMELWLYVDIYGFVTEVELIGVHIDLIGL